MGLKPLPSCFHAFSYHRCRVKNLPPTSRYSKFYFGDHAFLNRLWKVCWVLTLKRILNPSRTYYNPPLKLDIQGNNRAAYINTQWNIFRCCINLSSTFEEVYEKGFLAGVQSPHRLSLSYTVIHLICNTPPPLICAFESSPHNPFPHWVLGKDWEEPGWCHDTHTDNDAPISCILNRLYYMSPAQRNRHRCRKDVLVLPL